MGLVQRGVTSHFTVCFDSALGANGPIFADAILGSCERDLASLQSYFPGVQEGSFTINLTTDANGASHQHLTYNTLNVGGNTGTDPNLMRYLWISEAAECFMDDCGANWDADKSWGEALSRVLALDIVPLPQSVVGGFLIASTWLNTTRQDFVNTQTNTDQDFVAAGCGVLYLFWLRYQLDQPWPQIVGMDAATLGARYSGGSGLDGFARFKALLNQQFPPGSSVNLGTDNPFPIYGDYGLPQSLGGTATGSPAVGTNADGRLELFVRGTDHALWHAWQSAPNGPWTPWASLGGQLSSDPVVARNGDGRLEVFASAQDGTLWHVWQLQPNSGWSAGVSLGGSALGQPAAFRLASECLLVVVKDAQGTLHSIAQTAPNNGWGSWTQVGKFVSGTPCIVGFGATANILAEGTDHFLYSNVRDSDGKAVWSKTGIVLGGSPTALAAGPQNTSPRMTKVYARGSSGSAGFTIATRGEVTEREPNPPHPDKILKSWESGWAPWQDLGLQVPADAVITEVYDGFSKVRIVARDIHGTLQLHDSLPWAFSVPSGHWQALATNALGNPVGAVNTDGTGEIFFTTSDHRVWHSVQRFPGGG